MLGQSIFQAQVKECLFMKLKTLFLSVVSFAVASSILPASAVELDRTYAREGIKVNVFGSLAPTFSNTTRKFTYYGDCSPTFCPAADRFSASNGRMRLGSLEYLLEKEAEMRGDERTRLRGMDNGFAGFVVSQKIRNDLTASGMLGIGAGIGGGATAVGNFSLDRVNFGELTLGLDGRLPTGVGTTSTYNLLDRNGSHVSFRYRGIPNLRLTGFYAFPDLPSQNTRDRAIENGYGATATYRHSFAPRNTLDVRAGFTSSERANDLVNNRVARDKQAVMLAGRYNYYNTTFSLDGGVAKSDYRANIIDSTKATSLGARIDYEINPRVSIYGSYGVRKTEATEARGVTLDFATLYQNTAFVGVRPINESQLFKTIDETTYEIGASYNIHKNAVINASVGRDDTTYSLTTGKFSKLSEDTYSLGATLFW